MFLLTLKLVFLLLHHVVSETTLQRCPELAVGGAQCFSRERDAQWSPGSADDTSLRAGSLWDVPQILLRLWFLILLHFLPLPWTLTSQRGGCTVLERGGYKGPPGVWWSPLQADNSGRPSVRALGSGAYCCPRTEPAHEEAKGLSPVSQKQENDRLWTQKSGEFSSPYSQGRESDARLPSPACDPTERVCSQRQAAFAPFSEDSPTAAHL